ncbi:hypothetical protein AAHA92_05180 [Salvia divinorum]|uniref:Secreted protein n=1 Tax=Salvia divinorum TaxID=28513 RepID=A0ABD1I5N1_SALDI
MFLVKYGVFIMVSAIVIKGTAYSNQKELRRAIQSRMNYLKTFEHMQFHLPIRDIKDERRGLIVDGCRRRELQKQEGCE